ncbi:MAG: tRNA (adenosine(37)-N6)-threonylcarbamoyltransferase complex transferase subunit TsaD [Sphingobacteriaceae bacterium]|nr:tRNA (adenosine(37)-N6)-threonylcarbamoyltransferase complex transferase subunit TsaD [Sphingobacteriaceae bacterium]
MAHILAIESSCDDTSAAVISNGQISSNCVAGQQIHEQYGGVVPELASRAHHENIIPVVHAALEKAGLSLQQLDAIAVTAGPGLMGSLLVGTSFAKGLALALNKPLLAVNHMHAHIMAHFIDDPKPRFPFLCLTVSGGHTQLVWMRDYFDFEIVGQTIDDAAGEAFDKAAKMLGLPYPGGPLIDKYAATGNPAAFKFTEPNMPGFDYSFSGLKTGILYFLQKKTQENPNFIAENRSDLCASIQATIIRILLHKAEAAMLQYGLTRLAIAGGVSANSGLRKALAHLAESRGWELFVPEFQYCTDNAGMIAMAAHLQYEKGMFAKQSLVPDPRLPLSAAHEV